MKTGHKILLMIFGGGAAAYYGLLRLRDSVEEDSVGMLLLQVGATLFIVGLALGFAELVKTKKK